VYQEINKELPFAFLIDDLTPTSIAAALNKLLSDDNLYNQLQQNALKAREIYCWQNEEKKLINFYNNLFSN
jgi:glycosyltransferase involved in cell wall biosynthesis